MDKLILKIEIHGSVEVKAGDRLVNMVMFGGRCTGGLFEGEILPCGVDVQKITSSGGTLSARYALEGVDYTGECCRMFIENDAVLGMPFTEPKIITDSAALGWMNDAALCGRIINGGDGLTIEIARAGELGEDIV